MLCNSVGCFCEIFFNPFMLGGNKRSYIIKQTLREKCPYSELFYSTFSRIQTKYGEIWGIPPYLIKMREMLTRITPNTDIFYILKPATFSFMFANIYDRMLPPCLKTIRSYGVLSIFGKLFNISL